MSKSAQYITTPIYYVNDKPHIGHAYTSIATDMLARFYALDGQDSRLLTGTDEHGQKVEKSAEKAGKTPQEFTDEVSQAFRDLLPIIDVKADDFIRTTEERHKRGAQHLWQEIEKRGFIYESTYSGWYSIRDEAYYTEAELVDGKAPTGADGLSHITPRPTVELILPAESRPRSDEWDDLKFRPKLGCEILG